MPQDGNTISFSELAEQFESRFSPATQDRLDTIDQQIGQVVDEFQPKLEQETGDVTGNPLTGFSFPSRSVARDFNQQIDPLLKESRLIQNNSDAESDFRPDLELTQRSLEGIVAPDKIESLGFLRLQNSLLSKNDGIQNIKNNGFENVFEGQDGTISVDIESLDGSTIRVPVDNKLDKNIFDIQDAVGPGISFASGAVLGTLGSVKGPVGGAVGFALGEAGAQAGMEILARNALGAKADTSGDVASRAVNTAVMSALVDGATLGGGKLVKIAGSVVNPKTFKEIPMEDFFKPDFRKERDFLSAQLGLDLEDLTLAEQLMFQSLVTAQSLMENVVTGIGDNELRKRTFRKLVENKELNEAVLNLKTLEDGNVTALDPSLLPSKGAVSNKLNDLDLSEVQSAFKELENFVNADFKRAVSKQLVGESKNVDKFLGVTPINQMDGDTVGLSNLNAFQGSFKLSKDHVDELYSNAKAFRGDGEKIISVDSLSDFTNSLRDENPIEFQGLMSQLQGVLKDGGEGSLDTLTFEQAKSLRQRLNNLGSSGMFFDGNSISKGVFKKAAKEVSSSMDDFIKSNTNPEFKEYREALSKAQSAYKDVLVPLYDSDFLGDFLVKKGNSIISNLQEGRKFFEMLSDPSNDQAFDQVVRMMSSPVIKGSAESMQFSHVKESIRRSMLSHIVNRSRRNNPTGIFDEDVISGESFVNEIRNLNDKSFGILFPGGVPSEVKKSLNKIENIKNANSDIDELSQIMDDSNIPLDKAVNKAIDLRANAEKQYSKTISSWVNSGDFKKIRNEDPRKFVDNFLNNIDSIPTEELKSSYGKIRDGLPRDYHDKVVFELKRKIIRDNKKLLTPDNIRVAKAFMDDGGAVPVSSMEIFNNIFSNKELTDNLAYMMGEKQFNLFKSVNTFNLAQDVVNSDTGTSIARSQVILNIFESVAKATDTIIDEKKREYALSLVLNKDFLMRGYHEYKSKISPREIQALIAAPESIELAFESGLTQEDILDLYQNTFAPVGAAEDNFSQVIQP